MSATGRVFLFQAEDGIRDGHVTGVQTCALPISDEQVSAVRAAVAGGETVAAVARSFGVSRQTIYKALNGARSAALTAGRVLANTHQDRSFIGWASMRTHATHGAQTED